MDQVEVIGKQATEPVVEHDSCSVCDVAELLDRPVDILVKASGRQLDGVYHELLRLHGEVFEKRVEQINAIKALPVEVKGAALLKPYATGSQLLCQVGGGLHKRWSLLDTDESRAGGQGSDNAELPDAGPHIQDARPMACA